MGKQQQSGEIILFTARGTGIAELAPVPGPPLFSISTLCKIVAHILAKPPGQVQLFLSET